MNRLRKGTQMTHATGRAICQNGNLEDDALYYRKKKQILFLHLNRFLFSIDD